MKATYGTSITFKEEDFQMKERLKKKGHSIIETWRLGAKVILSGKDKELDKK